MAQEQKQSPPIPSSTSPSSIVTSAACSATNSIFLSTPPSASIQMSLPLSTSRFTEIPSTSLCRSSTVLLPPNTLSSDRSFSFNLALKFRNRIPASRTISATIAVGEKLPEATLSYFDSEGELQTTTVSDLTKGKKSILFAVPGAFTPTCSHKHLPGLVEKSDELKAMGVDTIGCISVNDAFVMRAWKENLKVNDEVFNRLYQL